MMKMVACHRYTVVAADAIVGVTALGAGRP